MDFKSWFESQLHTEWKHKKRQFGIIKHGGDRRKKFGAHIKDARYVKPVGHLVRRVFPDIQQNVVL